MKGMSIDRIGSFSENRSETILWTEYTCVFGCQVQVIPPKGMQAKAVLTG